MQKEWDEFLHFGAFVVVDGPEKEALLQQGHVVLPSK